MSIETRFARAIQVTAALFGLFSFESSAAAQATDLFISEYVEGTSNNKAIEIYNGTANPINLAAGGGYSIEMYFNGVATAGTTVALTGTVAAGDVYVLANSSASAAILSAADQTNGSSWYNGDDAIVLKKAGVVLDVIGQVGFDPGTEWGSGLASTADNTLRRKTTICQGDTNPSDVFDPVTQWDGFATDTFAGLGAHTASCTTVDNAPTVTGVVPANAASLDPTGNVVITWSEPVTTFSSWFSLTCGGNTISVTESGSGNTRTLDPDANLPSGASCTLTIFASNVSDTDGVPTSMEANYLTQFSVLSVGCGSSATLISAVQGSGLASPLVGNIVDIEGVVVADFQGSPDGLSGFHVEEEANEQDANPATSEGIFIFDNAGSVPVQVGDRVRVHGTVQEYFEMTELTNVTVTVCSSGNALPAPAPITVPVATPTSWENWEGMLVSVSGQGGAPLVVTETYTDGQFGEVTLAASRQFVPTNMELPTSPARTALTELNARSRIQLDDGRSAQNPSTPVPIPYVGANGTLRIGDTLTLGNLPAGQRVLTGALGYAFGVYEINPTIAIGPSSWSSDNPRPTVPALSGRLKVVSGNTLNYFKTIDTGSESTCASNANCCGPTGTLECRGATTASELTRQEAKLQDAFKAMNADLYALQELENPALSGARSAELALAGLVNLLNTAPNAAGTYAYITTGTIGTDAIKVGFIYKVATLQPVGNFQVLDNSDCATYRDNRNRPSLLQTFREIATGAKFSALVAHLKSKGSSCSSDGDGLDPDGQAECNGTRLAAAQCIRSWLATDPTGSGDPDVLLLGDMNAYTREDPITYLESNGYTDILRQPQFDGPDAYDYVFQGETGALSHALANNALMPQVSDALSWGINADEPRAFDYNSFNQTAAYAPDRFRASDHDPIMLGLTLTVPPPATSVPAGDARWLLLLAAALLSSGLYALRGRRAAR